MATPRRSSARTCFGCGRKKNVDPGPSPDDDFHADSLIKLSHGVTAYRIVEPRDLDESYDQLRPVVVCLHGMTNSSYMWADLTELLAEFEQGPRAKVLVFDFYGRGRSPWTGIPITLDTLVTQTKELIECEAITIPY